jgi:co-chaperonin GroES (HSP10)
MKVTGKLIPLNDTILVSDMHFGEETTKSGIILKSDDGKVEGIHPRWAKVWAVGPEQKDVEIGDWILIEHGRWSRAATYENEDGTVSKIQKVDTNAILLVGDGKPDDVYRADGV